MPFFLCDLLIGAYFGYIAKSLYRALAGAWCAAGFVVLFEYVILKDIGLLPDEGVIDVWVLMLLRSGASAAVFYLLSKKMSCVRQTILLQKQEPPAT